MTTPTHSNSTDSGLTLKQKIYEWRQHLAMRWQGRGRGSVLGIGKMLDSQVWEYAKIYRRVCGQDLHQAKLFEIGYGARPLRMFWLTSLGYDVRGIDLDRPVLEGRLAEFYEMWQKNGVQRLIKSLVRHFLFDRREWRELDLLLRQRTGVGLRVEPSRFFVGDAGAADFSCLIPGGADFVYSEDVLEHVPPPELETMLRNLAKGMRPGGCAVFRPHVFTSIGGGHLPEWYPHLTRNRLCTDTNCRSEPWEHLRRRRFKANTYLNELRLCDYRELIGRHFEILSEVNQDAELGRRFLTSAVRLELKQYSEEELLSNTVCFICVPHKS